MGSLLSLKKSGYPNPLFAADPRGLPAELPRESAEPPGAGVPEPGGWCPARIPPGKSPQRHPDSQTPSSQTPRIPDSQIPKRLIPGGFPRSSRGNPRSRRGPVSRSPGAGVPRGFPQVNRHKGSQTPRLPESQTPRFPNSQTHRFPESQIPRLPDSQTHRFPESQIPRLPDSQTPVAESAPASQPGLLCCSCFGSSDSWSHRLLRCRERRRLRLAVLQSLQSKDTAELQNLRSKDTAEHRMLHQAVLQSLWEPPQQHKHTQENVRAKELQKKRPPAMKNATRRLVLQSLGRRPLLRSKPCHLLVLLCCKKQKSWGDSQNVVRIPRQHSSMLKTAWLRRLLLAGIPFPPQRKRPSRRCAQRRPQQPSKTNRRAMRSMWLPCWPRCRLWAGTPKSTSLPTTPPKKESGGLPGACVKRARQSC